MLTHIDEDGNAKLVDISNKDDSKRLSRASGKISMKKETLTLIQSQGHKKGDVLTIAKVAGIQAAKYTSNIIPLCHSINLTSIEVDFKIDEKDISVECIATVKCYGQTGVEMEALSAVAVSLLTIYDMCKAADKSMIIRNIRLIEKYGGNSGTWTSEEKTET